MLRKDGLGRFKLYSKDGTKLLGNHHTKEKALAQERAIKAAETRRTNKLKKE
jgi:hypothetical protein